MRRGYVLHGAAAVAAAVLAAVVVLVLRVRTELADAVPRTESTIADAVAEAATAAPAAVEAAPLSAPEPAPAAVSCVSSESALAPATRPRPIRLNGSDVRERLLVSRDAEHLAAAALVSRNVRYRVADITKAVTMGPQNAVVAWTAVQICAAANELLPCPAQQWEEQLLKLDGQNSEVWIRVAARRLERGDATGALDAMQRAASAPESNAYWPDTVELVERGLAAAGGYSFSERAALAFGIAAANQPDYASQLKMCKAQSEANRAWADACLRYGETAEVQRKTALGQTSARTLQIEVLEVVGDDESIARVRARGRRTVATIDERRRADALIMSGPRPFARYLAKIRESGESAAVAYMLEEVLDEAASLSSPAAAADCR
jgi:hypothetical protein